MGPYRVSNKWDFSKIVEGVITAIIIAILVGGFNWFLGIREMKNDLREIRKQQKKDQIEIISQNNKIVAVINQIGKCIWFHIHPTEPYPFADLTQDSSYGGIKYDRP